jgi:hypothetical protein
MRYVKHLPLAAALLCASLAPSFADQIVYFVNGKAITVKSVEKGEKFTVLEMEGGGRVGVPTDQIARIEDYVVSEPVVAPVAAPAAPAVPSPQAAAAPSAAVQAITPGTPLPLPTTQQGPGIGGRPIGGPGQNVAGLKPIEIGEQEASGAPQQPAPRMGAANRGAANGPTMSGPQARPYAGGRRPGRPAFAGRGAGRLAAMNPANAPPAAGSQAAPGGAPAPGGASASPPPVPEPPPADSAPAAGSETEEPPPPPPDDSNEEPNDPAPPQDDSSGNTSGGPS